MVAKWQVLALVGWNFPSGNVFSEGWQWMSRLLFSIIRNVMSVSLSQVSKITRRFFAITVTHLYISTDTFSVDLCIICYSTKIYVFISELTKRFLMLQGWGRRLLFVPTADQQTSFIFFRECFLFSKRWHFCRRSTIVGDKGRQSNANTNSAKIEYASLKNWIWEGGGGGLHGFRH